MTSHPIKLGAAALLFVLGAWLAFAATGFPRALAPIDQSADYVLIDDVTVISMVPGSAPAVAGQSVLVEGATILAVGNADAIRANAERRENVLVIDGDGRTLLPGLIDSHVHVWDEAELAGYLAHGVTGIRNMSGMPFHLPLAERIEAGDLLGPDFLTTGPILNSPGPNQQDNHKLVSTAEEARAAVRRQYEQGYRELKVYSNLLPEAFDAITEEARARDMGISGHTPEGHRADGIPASRPFEITFSEAIAADFRTVEHVESIAWHGLRDRLDAEKMAALAQELAETGSAVTTTLVAHANLVRVAESRGAYLDRPGADTINPLLKALDKGTYDFWSGMDPAPREIPRAAFYLDTTKMLNDAGVPLLAGSDAGIFTNIPGESLHDELDLLVDAGLTPYQAIAAATVTPGENLIFYRRGVVAPGYTANLILVEGDPLADVSALRALDGVMLQGIWLNDDALGELEQGARQTSRVRTGRRLIAMLLAD